MSTGVKQVITNLATAVGYGGQGLCIQLKYQNPQKPDTARNIVVKVAVDKWANDAIQAEERETKVR
jgi:hypothetical protein